MMGEFGLDMGGSIDFGHMFMHFYVFITGTDSCGGFEPRAPPEYVHDVISLLSDKKTGFSTHVMNLILQHTTTQNVIHSWEIPATHFSQVM